MFDIHNLYLFYVVILIIIIYKGMAILKIFRNILISCVKFYKKCLSPLKGHAVCKFYPSCSTYAIQALELHGALKGSLLAIWRILRCNPFSKGGYDPVPEKKKKK